LITNSLKARGITARANLKGDCLRVMLESAQVPDQSAMVPFIGQGLMKLGIASIKTVKVYGKQVDTNLSAWSQDIDLDGAIAPAPNPPNPVLQITSAAEVGVRSHQPVHAFQYSIFVSGLIFLGIIPFSVIVLLFLQTILREMNAHPPIVIALINVLLTTAIILYFRVYISPAGIKSHNFWGKYYFVEWSSITAIKLYQILGFKYLLVSSTQAPKTLWVPLFLADMLRFRRLVCEYAGAEHLLTERLQGKGSYSLLLEQTNGQIKAGWLAACVVGGATLFLVIYPLSAYNPNGLDSLWSLIDVALSFGLAFGIYKKSRIAAVIMLIYYIFGRIAAWIILGRISLFGVFISIVFIGCFVEGIRGTFAYHKLIKSQN
jgi:hypothetical protein